MLSKLLLLTFCFWVSYAFAQDKATLHPSYVSIQMSNDPIDGPTIRSTICGGVVVDEMKRLVATSWHCVPNQRSVVEKPGIFTAGGSNAKLVTLAPEADMAIFQVENLKGLKAAKMSTPKKNDMVTASAYYDEFQVVAPMQDRYMPQVTVKVTLEWEGKVAAIATASRRGGERGDQVTATPYEWIVVNGNAAQGFSGGPAFDKAGNFVGIIANGNGGFTNISSARNIATILKTLK